MAAIILNNSIGFINNIEFEIFKKIHNIIFYLLEDTVYNYVTNYIYIYIYIYIFE